MLGDFVRAFPGLRVDRRCGLELGGRGNAVRGIKFGHQDQGAAALWPRARQWREVCKGEEEVRGEGK